jgi:hypothetical protein
MYGVVTGIAEYAALTGQDHPSFKLARINAGFLFVMFALGTLSFIPRKR